jgi:DtxR family manganese transport transcriptional regulator
VHKLKKNKFEETREAHARELAEDYVEAIWSFGKKARVTELARYFGVSHVTVIKTVGRLESLGLVSTAPYKEVTLTKSGEKLAELANKRHTIVYNFLLKLGIDEETATRDSEGIEHHVSEKTLKAFENFLG